MRVNFVLALLVLAGCSSRAAPAEPPARSTAASADPPARASAEAPLAPVRALPGSTHPAPERLVAIGDVHGDLDAFRRALRLAGAIDEADRWSGGVLWIVQTGDVLDRGDDEDEILALISRLEGEAERVGGRFLALNGNHELMNAQGDFRYVTPDGFADFAELARRRPRGVDVSRLPRQARGRAAAFAPGGRYARELAGRNTVIVVGDTVFVHGGLAARHAERGLDAINEEARAFFLGEAPLSATLTAEDGPVWHRAYGLEPDAATCAELDAVLERVHARRMVIGHTVQEHGINAACDEHVWRIDVGLAEHYGGPTEVLELTANGARMLRAPR